MYKSLIDESGVAVYDNRDDLLKIATLLVVGQHLDKSKQPIDKGIESAYNEIYRKLWISSSSTL